MTERASAGGGWVVCRNEGGDWEVWFNGELVDAGFVTEDAAWRYIDKLDTLDDGEEEEDGRN